MKTKKKVHWQWGKVELKVEVKKLKSNTALIAQLLKQIKAIIRGIIAA